jgi:hypothetical protein
MLFSVQPFSNIDSTQISLDLLSNGDSSKLILLNMAAQLSGLISIEKQTQQNYKSDFAKIEPIYKNVARV